MAEMTKIAELVGEAAAQLALWEGRQNPATKQERDAGMLAAHDMRQAELQLGQLRKVVLAQIVRDHEAQSRGMLTALDTRPPRR